METPVAIRMPAWVLNAFVDNFKCQRMMGDYEQARLWQSTFGETQKQESCCSSERFINARAEPNNQFKSIWFKPANDYINLIPHLCVARLPRQGCKDGLGKLRNEFQFI